MVIKDYTNTKVFHGKNPNVWKYVFSNEDSVVEAVLYRYQSFEKRTVICCSTQSGCSVGCTFCGTGNKFLKNLTPNEIIHQSIYILEDNKIDTNYIKKFQIMFMSMGEPMLNWNSVEIAIKKLHKMYSNANLLISSIGVNAQPVLARVLDISKQIKQVGLQFSIHEYTDERRHKIIPYAGKMTLQQISDYGKYWYQETGRNPFLNYIVTPDNSHEKAVQELYALFDPSVFRLTLSVFCEIDKRKPQKTDKKLKLIKAFHEMLAPLGYNMRIFNPAGQDDIGGGCGQLWFVQEFLKKYGKKNTHQA